MFENRAVDFDLSMAGEIKKVSNFRSKRANARIFIASNEHPGILVQIVLVQTGPLLAARNLGTHAPGVRMTVVNTNSLKLIVRALRIAPRPFQAWRPGDSML